jgi:hypothetical protein
MNSNVPMKQETKPTQFAEHSPVLTGLSVQQRYPKGSATPPITCGKLHPSPPNSQPSPAEPSYCPEPIQEPQFARIHPPPTTKSSW